MIQRDNQGKIEAALSREVQRLRRRDEEVRRLVEEVSRRYPSAERFFEDLQLLEQADRQFLELLEEIDWATQFESVRRQLEALVEAPSDAERLVLCWESQGQHFYRDGRKATLLAEPHQATVEVARWMDDYGSAVSPGSVYGEGVTYPILFSHEVEGNHRAVAASLGWTLVAVAAQTLESTKVELVAQDLEMTLYPGGDREVDELPGADEFGFRKRGELWRRVEEFDQVDPEAHWQRWFGDRDKLHSRRQWTLREQGGATVRLEVRRDLCRLRILERPRSAVVRKRHRVFVDPSEEVVRDRYFADPQALDGALAEISKAKTEEGFRVVER